MDSLALGCGSCGAVGATLDADGHCSRCTSPEGVTITPPRDARILDAAKFMRVTLCTEYLIECGGEGLPPLAVMTAWAILSAAIDETVAARRIAKDL